MEALWYKIGKDGLSEGKRKKDVRRVRMRQIKFTWNGKVVKWSRQNCKKLVL